PVFAGAAKLARSVRVGATVYGVDRARLLLGAGLHFGRELADPRGVRERTDLVRHDADRQRHQRNPPYVATSVASEQVPRLAIGLRVLVRDQLVEERDHLLAAYLHLAERDVEDEIVSADVPDEPVRLVRLHDVAQNPREHADDAVALVVT